MSLAFLTRNVLYPSFGQISREPVDDGVVRTGATGKKKKVIVGSGKELAKPQEEPQKKFLYTKKEQSQLGKDIKKCIKDGKLITQKLTNNSFIITIDPEIIQIRNPGNSEREEELVFKFIAIALLHKSPNKEVHIKVKSVGISSALLFTKNVLNGNNAARNSLIRALKPTSLKKAPKFNYSEEEEKKIFYQVIECLKQGQFQSDMIDDKEFFIVIDPNIVQLKNSLDPNEKITICYGPKS